MFLKITRMDSPEGAYKYLLQDSKFEQEVDVRYMPAQARSVAPEIALIKVYLTHKQPIAPNMARMYRYYIAQRNMVLANIETYRDSIDTYFPEYKYGSLYYPCVQRQMKQLMFGSAK